MQSELKPCDFCGSSDHLRVVTVGVMTSDMPDRPHRVVCSHIDHDDVQGPVAYGRAGAITAWNTRASDAEITRLTEALRAAEEREKALREALVATEDAIAEYYRYWTGGEMRGSYDGKPERNGLWQALHKARQALAGAKP